MPDVICRIAKHSLVAAAFFATAMLAPSLRAEVSEDAYAKVNRALTDGIALPGYRGLAHATARFHQVTSHYCRGDTKTGLGRVRQAYQDTMDDWMRVQAIGFGPVELFMRNFRLYFWPAPGRRVGKSVDEWLAGTDPLSVDRLRKSSVAVQGLPAAEWVLFHGGSNAPARKGRGCALLLAIAQNVKDISADILAEWSGGKTDFRARLLAPGPANPHFATSKEVSLAYFKSLYQGLDLIVAAKLGPLVTANVGKSKKAAPESALSGRSLRNIVLNLQTARALYLGRRDDGFTVIVQAQNTDRKLDPLMRRAFKLTLETAMSIKPPLARALADPTEKKKLEKLLLQTRALKRIVATRLAKALGLAVGFNALDGD